MATTPLPITSAGNPKNINQVIKCDGLLRRRYALYQCYIEWDEEGFLGDYPFVN